MHDVTQEEINEYMSVAQRSMLQFQLIEEGLKAHISIAHQVIQRSIPAELHFKFSNEEIDSMPLERLINTFTRYTRNSVLVKQLNEIRGLRNHLAHRAFALAFFSTLDDESDFPGDFAKVKQAQTSSASAFLALKEEIDLVDSILERMGGQKGVA